jgi:hypothetical protein
MIALDLALTSTGHGHPGREVDRLFSPCICVRSSERRAAYEFDTVGDKRYGCLRWRLVAEDYRLGNL